jgi:hypothetical protein
MISGIEMLLSNLFVDNTENHGNTVLPVRVELFFTDTQSCLVTYHYYYASYDTDENEEFEDLVSDVQSTPELYKVRNIDKAQTFYIKSGNIVVQHSAQHITNILRILRGKTTQLFLVNS